MSDARLTTTVIGAGPAGLLFCAVARLLHARGGGDPAAWTLRLFDKRDTYARTHRLRMDPTPYAELQREVADPRFDAFVRFLEEHDHAPEVNALEATLLELVEGLAVEKEHLAIGDGPDEISLAALRARLEADGSLPPGTRWTIVAADSVRSAVREAVRGAVEPTRHTHQRVARLRVLGERLPARLGIVDQYRLSKVLGSLLDYRLNRNGYAELDLFLTQAEHEAVRALGGTPREPVPLSARMLGRVRAPLFRRLVEHFERGLTTGPCRVELHSTFLLEHSVMPRVLFEAPALGAHVLLVGDAGVSLPFFRGMACLARCVGSLARVHVDLLEARAPADEVLARYEREVEEVRRRELAVVGARARLIRGLREFARLSALLPFPLQSWWLSSPEAQRPPDRVTFGLLLNVALAAAAAAVCLGGSAQALTDPALGWIAWLAWPLQLAGGVAFHAALELEAGPHRWVRRVWQVQIFVLFVAGVGTSEKSTHAVL